VKQDSAFAPGSVFLFRRNPATAKNCRSTIDIGQRKEKIKKERKRASKGVK